MSQPQHRPRLSRRQFLRGLLLTAGGMAVGSCKPTPAQPTPTQTIVAQPTASASTKIMILHWNDLHGALLATSKGDKTLGGVAHLVGLADNERASAPGPVLLLDAGDALQGTYVSNSNQGEAVIDVFNAAGLQALTLGNHEFDWGLEALRARIDQAQFPFLAANLEAEPGHKLEDLLPDLLPYTILELDGFRVGILGLTYHDLKSIVRASAIEGLRSLPPVHVVQRYLPELNAQSDLIVVLSHLGLKGDKELARAVPEIPIIVGGHSHRVLRSGEHVGNTLVVQAGAYGEYLGHLTMPFDRGSAQSAAQSAIIEVTGKGTPNAKVKEIVQEWSDKAAKAGSQVVGEAAIHLRKGRGVELALGNMITDAMRAADLGDGRQADIVLHNDGGIRADLDAGPITYAELYSVLPFDNSLIGLDLDGAQVLAMLEDSINDQSSEIQVSGLSFAHRPSKPRGQRILEATVAGQPLDPQRTYRVVTIDYLHTHPQYERSLGQGTNVTYGGLALDAVIEYVRAHSPVQPQVEQRLRKE